MTAPVERPEEWQRPRGRSLQFYATDAEIGEWLCETVPTEFGPYTAIAVHYRDSNRDAVELPLETINDWLNEHRDARLWLRSGVLTPGVDISNEAQLSFSGLIMILPGRDWEGKREETWIAMLDRIRHSVSGEERRYPDYLRIFERLRRSMRKKLVVRTTETFPDGTSSESWPMTELAADAHNRGEVTFAADPAA